MAVPVIVAESAWPELERRFPDIARQIDAGNARYYCVCDQPEDAGCR